MALSFRLTFPVLRRAVLETPLVVEPVCLPLLIDKRSILDEGSIGEKALGCQVVLLRRQNVKTIQLYLGRGGYSGAICWMDILYGK
jgi:hypothetical protein